MDSSEDLIKLATVVPTQVKFEPAVEMTIQQAAALMRIYDQIDANHSGGVSKRELRFAFKEAHSSLHTDLRRSISDIDEADAYLVCIDKNEDGQISADEWVAFWEKMGGGGEALDTLIQGMKDRVGLKTPRGLTRSKTFRM